MFKKVSKYVLWFVGLIFLQVVVLSHMNLSKWIFPFGYLFFFLYVEKQMAKWLILLLGFTMGLMIDMFLDTHGLHTFATTLIAYLRPYVLAPLAPRDSVSENIEPTFRNLGLNKYLAYAGIIVFVHHFLIFYIDEFSIDSFFSTLLQVILSSIASLLVILSLQLIFIKKT